MLQSSKLIIINLKRKSFHPLLKISADFFKIEVMDQSFVASRVHFLLERLEGHLCCLQLIEFRRGHICYFSELDLKVSAPAPLLLCRRRLCHLNLRFEPWAHLFPSRAALKYIPHYENTHPLSRGLMPACLWAYPCGW